MLIFRLGSIGDTVVALPCFHAIARAFPNHRRVLLTNALTSARASSAESVLDGSGLVDEVLYYPVGDFSIRQMLTLRRQLRSLHASFMIYLAERPTAAPVLRDLLFFAAAGVRKVRCSPWQASFRDCRIESATGELEYEVQRLARTLRRVIPVDLSPASWDLRLLDAEHAKADALIDETVRQGPVIGMAPGAKVPAKDWGADRWAALLDMVAEEYRGFGLVLVGALDERAMCEELARHWRGPVANLCGLLTPRETAAALSRCTIMACHDSGPMHLAASQGTACIALFGNYNLPRRWYPYGERHEVIHELRGVREITVQRVADALRSRLDAVTSTTEHGLMV